MNRQLTFNDERNDFAIHLADISNNRHPISLALDNVADERNLGALFRLADAARLEAIYTFEQELQKERAALRKVARAADKYVPHISIENWASLREQNPEIQLVALEVTENSIPIWDFKLTMPIVLVVGNEKNGVSAQVLELADACLHLPMYGVNTSMNVAMAAGIAIYELLRKIKS
jgi:tRNA G18 (ribose-2'-O)-methylase SpoU